MPVSPHFETGTGYESLHVTIGKFIKNKWATVAPALASPTPDFLYGENNTHNWPLQSGAFSLAFNDGDEFLSEGNTSSTRVLTGIKSLVRIDIQAPIVQYANIAVDKIQNIMIENAPNSATRIKKSNGTDDSKIWCFGKPVINWTKPPILKGLKAPAIYYRGYMEILWQKDNV